MHQALRVLFESQWLKVSRADIEEQLRSVESSAQQVLKSAGATPVLTGALAGLAAIASAYLLGRHKGRRRASVLEVRRG